MKFLQSALCGFLLTVTAAAQTAPTSPSTATPKPATPQATTPAISGLDGEAVKGPEHPLTLDQMKVLYVALGYDKQVADIDANRDKMIAQNKARNPYMPTSVWDDLDASFKKIDYQGALYDVYKKYLSTEDAAKLIDFSKTEAGKDYFANAAALNRESAMTIQKQEQQASQQVQTRHKDEIDAAMKKYRDEHAPKPASTPAGTTPATPAGSSTPGASPAPAATPAKPATTTPPPANPPASTAPQN
jgi:hypothetical protein